MSYCNGDQAFTRWLT